MTLTARPSSPKTPTSKSAPTFFCTSAREQGKYFATTVENNTQTRDAYLQQFNVGQRSLLDVLDSENELYSSSIQLVTSNLNEVAALYRLKALGGELLTIMNIEKNSSNVNTDALAQNRQP